jgi:hypothetical protein
VLWHYPDGMMDWYLARMHHGMNGRKDVQSLFFFCDEASVVMSLDTEYSLATVFAREWDDVSAT